jgi:hypothetical protein
MCPRPTTKMLRLAALIAVLSELVLGAGAHAQQIITSGGNTYSTGLTAGTMPVANGPTGLGPSSFTDNGMIAGTTEPFTAPHAITVANFNNLGVAPGTTQYALVILQTLGGTTSEATIATTGTTQGILGICAAGCGGSGNATIVRWGAATCSFDQGTVAGDYVVPSTTTGGDCHDTGSNSYPTSGSQPLGWVLSTNSGAGNYAVILDPGIALNSASSPVTLGAGLASTPGTYNGGTQTFTGGGAIYLQSYPTALTASCTVNSNCVSGSTNDAGRNFIFMASGQTATLPSPSSSTSVGFTFTFDGIHTYSLAASSGNFIGTCGNGTSSLSGIAYDVQLTPDATGTNWLCHPSMLGIIASQNIAFSGNNTHSGTETFNGNVIPSGPVIVTSSQNIDPTSTAMCGGVIQGNSATAITLTFLSTWPSNCNVAVDNVNAGLVSIAAGSSATLHTACTTARTRAQYSVIWLHGEATGTVNVSGDCG